MGVVRLPFTCGQELLKPEEAVNMADHALYKAKGGGRNCAVAIVEQSFPDTATRHRVEGDFDQALADGLVHLQMINGPLVSVTGSMQRAA